MPRLADCHCSVQLFTAQGRNNRVCGWLHCQKQLHWRSGPKWLAASHALSKSQWQRKKEKGMSFQCLCDFKLNRESNECSAVLYSDLLVSHHILVGGGNFLNHSNSVTQCRSAVCTPDKDHSLNYCQRSGCSQDLMAEKSCSMHLSLNWVRAADMLILFSR